MSLPRRPLRLLALVLGAEDTMFGGSLDRIGRFDDDDIDDLAIGAPAFAPVSCAIGEAPGRAYVVLGGSCPR